MVFTGAPYPLPPKVKFGLWGKNLWHPDSLYNHQKFLLIIAGSKMPTNSASGTNENKGVSCPAPKCRQGPLIPRECSIRPRKCRWGPVKPRECPVRPQQCRQGPFEPRECPFRPRKCRKGPITPRECLSGSKMPTGTNQPEGMSRLTQKVQTGTSQI